MEPVERATKLETVFQPYGNFSPGHMLCIWADRSYMWENDTVVISVTIKLMKRVVWQLMSTQYMYDLGIAVTSANIKLHIKIVWPRTRGPNKKE